MEEIGGGLLPDSYRDLRSLILIENMNNANKIIDGSSCKVIAGTHKGKSGIARDLNISKTGHLTITIVQENGVRFKTLAKNVEAV